MINLRLKDLPQEAQEMLRDLDHDSAFMLAVDAMRTRDEAHLATFPTDPLEGMREVHKIGRATVEVEFDDPVGMALDMLEEAITALHRKDFDSCGASSLARVLETAEAGLRVYADHQKEVDDRIRAILFPQK